MFYHAGDSQHTQNIQINEILVKMKNTSFILLKKLNGLFGQPSACTPSADIPSGGVCTLVLPAAIGHNGRNVEAAHASQQQTNG